MPFDLDTFLRAALDEDVGGGDVTTNALFAPDLKARGTLKLREGGTVAGLNAALAVFELLDPAARVEARFGDGSAVAPDTVVGSVAASARAVVTGERLALNLLGRLSGIATLTRRYVDAVKGTGVAICETRKTTPLLRALEKAAVKSGGGTNHRFGLHDAVLVKDNHLDQIGASGDPAGMAAAAYRVRAAAPAGTFIQLEARTEEEALAIATAGADSVLFDNFTPPRLKAAVAAVRAAVKDRAITLEASGGITLETVRAFAETGVDRLSIGALTHSARSLDVTLDIVKA